MAVPPPSPPPHGDKPALREALRARRHDLVASLGEAGARDAAYAAADQLVSQIAPGLRVAVYLALRDELDPEALTELLADRGQPLALPWLGDDVTMGFRAWTPGDELMRGPFRLRQPLESAPLVAPDLIVTPLLGFDRAGGRIGQGASHYDRAFARFPGARRVGYAWSVQEVAAVPHDPWDVALHAVATEREWIVAP